MNTREILNNKSVAEITSALTRYKTVTDMSQWLVEEKTPMLNCYKEYVQSTGQKDTRELRERFLRCARYLKWNVARRGGVVYENGIAVWNTAGLCEKAATN